MLGSKVELSRFEVPLAGWRRIVNVRLLFVATIQSLLPLLVRDQEVLAQEAAHHLLVRVPVMSGGAGHRAVELVNSGVAENRNFNFNQVILQIQPGVNFNTTLKVNFALQNAKK